MSHTIRGLKGDLITRESSEYRAAITRWAATAERQAEVVVFVKDAGDVSLAIKYAKDHEYPIAIRDGGYSVSGASSAEKGLVIDCSRYLDYADVDSVGSTVRVGGGTTWETVNKATMAHGLATVGGTIDKIGVAGLTLVGGYGYLSGLHGLALDSLEEATVVVADGSILRASKSTNPDLFYAIRGGGSNFGVVTQLTFRLYPQRRTVYAGKLVFARDAAKAVLELTVDWRTGEEDPNASMIQVFKPDSEGKPKILCFLYYNGSEAEGRHHFRRLLEIGPITDDTADIPYAKTGEMMNFLFPPGRGVYQKGIPQRRPDVNSTLEVIDRLADASHPGGPSPLVVCEYFPLQRILASDPNDETSCLRRDTSIVGIYAFWDELTAENFNKGQAIVRDIATIVQKSHSYLAEPDERGERGQPDDKARATFGAKYPKLQHIKKKYDPENIFNRWCPITPA
ncbi:FAD-binding domain-containing protein [Schizophyllum commune H4-8]|nr:FAD-binding domain-containing protein [Schizophyllum commune H4-8]KAI5898048.1 FAD-binding domain-containing protein [Schizophyllum commune H4-8]